jgi:hypothetical protein
LGGDERNARRLLQGSLLLALLALLVLVAVSPRQPIYDERYFTAYLTLLDRYGLSKAYLRSLPEAMGPLYAFVHAAFADLTSLHPLGMRAVNLALFAAVTAIVAGASGHTNSGDRWTSAGSVLAVPMAWVLGGMALSEMPALVFATLSLWLQLKGLERIDDRPRTVAWFAASAICLGISVWGRQPFFLLGAIPVLLAAADSRLRAAAAISACITLALALPLFIAWQGLTPPAHRFMQQPPSFMNGIASLGYVGVCLLFLVPGLVWQHRRRLLWAFGIIVLANAMFSLWELYPLRSTVAGRLPGYALWLYGTLWGAVILTFSLLALAFIGRAIWQARHDHRAATINLGLLLMAIWPAFQGLYYSSRYTGMCLPFLLLSVEPLRPWRLSTAIAALAGCIAGAVSLAGYYFQ